MTGKSQSTKETGVIVNNEPEESALLKKINNSFMMGKEDTVGKLQMFLGVCSDSVFCENCVKWLQFCCKVEGIGKPQMDTNLEMFATLITLSRQFPELGRSIASNVSSRFVDVFVKRLTGIQKGWDALKVLMTCYNNSLAAFKENLENMMRDSLDSAKPIFPYQSQCFALIPSLGGGGTAGVTHKTNWRQQMDHLTSVCENILKNLAASVNELQSSETQSFPVKSFGDEIVRLGNANSVIQSMLLQRYPTNKNVPAQALFSLVRSGVSIVDKTNVDIRGILSQVHQIMLKTLTAIIVSCERTLLPFSTMIIKLLDQELEFSEQLPELRTVVYSSFCNWMVVAKAGSGVNRIAKNLSAALLLDIQTRRNVVTLKGKRKKMKKEVTRSQLPLPFNETVSFSALKTLEILFNSAGFMLTPETHKEVQQTVIGILLGLKKCGPSTPLYGESDRCRATLYQVLLMLCLEPCPQWPPPTQFATQLLRYGQEDACPQVSSVCATALTMIDRIIHPEFSVAVFPVDYTETVKAMQQQSEEDCAIETASESPLPLEEPVIVENGENNASSDVNGAIDDFSVIPHGTIVDTPPENQPDELIREEAADVIVIDKDVTSESSQDSITKVSNENGQIANDAGSEKRVSSKKRSKPCSSSESDSVGTPPKRTISEHSYNLRPKTPKSGTEGITGVLQIKIPRLDTSALAKGSPNVIDVNDADDVTVLFDETIID